MVYNALFLVETRGLSDIIDITGHVSGVISESGLNSGAAIVFVPGSTAGVTSIEYEPGAVSDLKAAIERVAPEGIHYDHDARWGDGNGFSHVRAALLGASFTVPFVDGVLSLGTWQQIVLIDFDNKGRNRKVTVQLIGE
ncbi:MAG TPA: YjbQ family protein [Nitrospirae bacterium]|nr:YjbQ family protein [Nitrospirota bacterium]